ncbi:MAG: hypothetical protein JNK65_09665, partial [Deltaproteobacteria bacterium]|nr:hypothetical protein [Deltaproteobacteria bacterium]
MNLKAKVLDSWAMLAFFENEKSALDVDKILIESQKLGFPLFMSVINLGVIWYSTLRGYSETVAQQIIQEIFGLGIQIIDSDWPLVK